MTFYIVGAVGSRSRTKGLEADVIYDPAYIIIVITLIDSPF